MKNFVFIFYKKKKHDLIVHDGDYSLSCQEKLLKKSILRIKKIYPHSKIHLITNIKDYIGVDFDFLHFFDSSSNHLIKFQIYGLLDEESVYLDADVLVKRAFFEDELETKFDLKFFNLSHHIKIDEISNYPNRSNVYNAGVVYIKVPNKKITDDLFEIESSFFYDKDFLIKNKIWPYNDEYSLSIFLDKNKIYFSNSDTVNIPCDVGSARDMKIQSIHYTGLHNKHKYFKDSAKLRI